MSRKWSLSTATAQVKSDLRHRDILGLGESRPSWRREMAVQRRHLVVKEVCCKSRQQGVQRLSHKPSKDSGRDGRELRRKLSWRELLGMEVFHISFTSHATDDVSPSPYNLNEWYGEDPTCPLCPSPTNLKHILFGCKTSLSQGC